jgi:hypothetical protein
LQSNVAFVAAGFSLRCTGETPVPLGKIGKKYSIGRNSVSQQIQPRSHQLCLAGLPTFSPKKKFVAVIY